MTDTQNSAGVPVAFNLALSTIERDVRVSDLTDGEKLMLVAAALEAHIAANEAAMPTIWEDPAGKGYPCFERPMTPAEAKREIERLQAHIAAFNELLCVIHGDGGHYIDQHGQSQAIADAMQLSSERSAHIAAEPERIRAVVERCAKVTDDIPYEKYDDCDLQKYRIAAAIRAQETGQ